MARSLVERLELRASQQFVFCVTSDHEAGYYDGSEHAYRNAANIAKPYEARRLALEKVAEAATAILKSQDDHAMTLDVRLVIALRTFLAAVPEIPEES